MMHDGPLYFSIKNNDATQLAKLLQTGIDVNRQGEDGRTPLYYAVDYRKPEAVDLLLDYGADPDSSEYNGSFPLFRAARNGDAEIVQRLIKAGANVNRLDGSGWSALHTAAAQGYADVVGLLLEADAVLDMRNQYGWTPLFLAVGNGQKAVVEKLLAAGADILAKDARGMSLLQYAQKRGYQEITLLLQQAANLLPKDYLTQQSNGTNWEELIWNWPNADKPYTADQWQEILDGLVKSFSEFLDIRFVHAEIPTYYEENDCPCISFRLAALSPTPLGPLNFLGLGSMDTYVLDDENNNEKGLSVTLFLFVFLDGVRIKADPKSDSEILDDYLEFHFWKPPGETSRWEKIGWMPGYPCEWDGLTFPEIAPVTNRLQVIPPYVPDPDDERYDPVTEVIQFCQCPICQDDNVYPWRDRNSYELFWICGCCESAWKKHGLFVPENVVDIDGREIEELPYQHIVDDVAHYGTFPLEASHIRLFTSNRFLAYECQMPQEFFEEFALASHWKMEPIKEPTCIPRYHFRSFLEEQRRILSVEELRRRLSDSPFLHRAEQGFEYRLKKRNLIIHVVYDTGNGTLYFYRFIEGGDDPISEKSRRFHETLQELCRERSAE